MAKKMSFKNQIFQQIANQQVQQVLNQQREQQTANLMADFNSFMEQQQNPEALMADFNAWKEQNSTPVQPAPQPQVKASAPSQEQIPSIADFFKPITASGKDINKATANYRNREEYQRQQQLEQIEAAQLHNASEREVLASLGDISKKLSNITPETEALDTITKTWKRGQRPEATDTSSQAAARVTNERKPEIDTTNVPVNVDRWLSPDTKLTEAEKKRAKEYASAELQKVQYGPNKMPLLNTPEERQHYADMVNLINKTNSFTNFMSGAIEVPYNLADMVSDGARSVGNQLGGLGTAITDKLGITEGATQRHNEQAEIANQFADQNEANMRQNFKNAQTQNPGAYTAGKIAGQTGMYMLTNPVFDGIAAGAGVESELAKFFINQGAQNVQDLVLDTAPTVRQLMEDGSTPEEVKREALNNILWNVAGNAVMGGLGAWAGNRAARKASDEAFRENVRAGADNLSRIANEIPGIEDVDNVVRNATTQIADAAQNIENLNKQIPNLPDYVTGGPTGSYDVNSTLKSFNDMEKDLNNFGKIHDELGKEIDNINDPTLKEGFKNLNDTYSRMVSEALQDGGVSASEWDEITEAYSKAHKELSESAENYIKQNSFGPDIDNALNDIQSFIDGFSGEKELHKELTDSLDEVKNAIRNGGDIEGARAKLDNALNSAAEIVQQDNDSLLGDITSEAFKKVKSATDGSVIRLSKSVLKDALGDDAIFSNLNDMVYTGKGSIKFREGSGVPIDSIYNELRGLSDYELPEAHTEADQVAAIAKYISDVKAKNITPDNSAINEVKRLGNSLDEGIGNYNKSLASKKGQVPKDYSIQEVNRKGGKKGYYVAESVGGGATKNVEPGKVYKTKKEAENALGNYKLQTFAGGDTPKEKWNVSKYRTNTVEKQGWGDKLSEKHFGYRVYSEAEQNADAAAKNLSADDLIYKDQFDPSDVKQAMKRQRELLASDNEEDIFKADRLARKLAAETREAGRVPQALAEFDRTTPEGQVRLAQRAIDDIVDKKVGTGTSEALDNIVEKINKAYDKHGNDKKAFADEVSDILSGTLRENVKSKVAKKMAPKAIKGKDKVLSMIENGASLQDIADVVYKQNGGAKLSAMENKQIYDMLVAAQKLPEGSYEQEELIARAAKIATNKTPSTLGQKIRNILYNNMLGNLKTAVSRNFFGNLTYQTLEQGRQPISAVIDKATSAVTKKHSALGWNKGKAQAYLSGFKQGGSDQIKDIARHIDTGRSGSKGWENALKNNATTYSNDNAIGKFLNNVQYYVTNAMELGDRPFFEANYKQAVTELHQMVDRYGKDGVAGLEGIKDADIDDVIDMIASVHAADSVFQKQGKMSKALTNIRNGLGQMSEGAVGVDILSTASTPFTMTPGNMLERAIEYTPLGFVKNAAETAGEVLGKKGFNQRRFVDEASRSIAGLPILYGAYKLAENGSINGGLSTDKDEKQAQLDDGFIEYGYNVPDNVPILGGKTLDTSDLPVIGPFMQAGAVIAENGLTPSAAFQAGEAVLGGSATQGLRRAFGGDSSSYSSQNGILENLKNTFLSSGSQLIPSLARQTAQTIDPYKRDLGEYGTSEYYFNLMKNADPVGRQSLPIKYDTEGQPILQNQGRNIGSKILENYLLPMNVSEYKPTALNQEASRLREVADTAQGFTPKADRADLRKWDETAQKEYTEEQFREYKKDLGTLNSSAGNAVIESDFYKNLDDGTKAKTLSSVYSAMKSIAKENATGIQTDDKIAIAYKNGGTEGMINYLAGKDAVKDSGTTSQSKVGQAIQEAADNGNTEAAYDMAEQVQLLPTYGLDKPGPGATYTKAYNVYDGLSAQDFAKIYNAIDTDHNQGLKKTEVLEYMNKQHFNENDGMKFWKAYAVTEGSRAWKIPSLNDGTWK